MAAEIQWGLPEVNDMPFSCAAERAFSIALTTLCVTSRTIVAPQIPCLLPELWHAQ